MSDRIEKTIDVGGTSDAWDIPHIVEMAKIVNPKSVLDVGTGCFGKNAYILRQYVEHKFRGFYNPQYMSIGGLEAYTPNWVYLQSLKLYDYLYNQEALEYLDDCDADSVDLVMCTHVLEHHIEHAAWRLLERMHAVAKCGIILACPLGVYEHIDENNAFQNHRSTWTPEKISKKYPITSPIIGRNNVGMEEFLIFIPTNR